MRWLVVGGLAFISILTISLMLVMFEAGWVRNHLDKMTKNERDPWRFGWMAELVIAVPSINYTFMEETEGKAIFGGVILIGLSLVWWGFLIGGLLFSV